DSHRQGEWAFTYNWHFIDARDDPPNECSVNFKRDCDFRDHCASHKTPGCVVGAIANMVRGMFLSILSRRRPTLFHLYSTLPPPPNILNDTNDDPLDLSDHLHCHS